MSASTGILHSSAVPDVTSMKLSIPNPTSEMLPATAPAITCLTSHQMPQAETDCCKKMAGDCHRGAGEHPCCKTTSKVDPPIATVQKLLQFHPDVAILRLTPSSQPEPATEGEVAQAH